MLVWLASYPRSGNSYFRVTSGQLFGVKTFSVYPGDGAHLSKQKIRDTAMTKNSILVKTHELPRDQYRAIYLVRDGRDSVISYAHWTLSQETEKESIDPKSPQFQNRLRNIITTSDYFGGWSRHVLAWHERPNRHIVRFEDLVADPVEVVGKALEFANLPCQADPKIRPVEFKSLQAKNPVLYRKGIFGNWKTDMSPDMQELFWRKCGAAMKLLGYT